VVVDRVPRAPFGVRGRVLRLSSALREDEPGGPVLDPKGRIVAVAFAVDPSTGLAVTVPLSTLRSLVASRALETLEPPGSAPRPPPRGGGLTTFVCVGIPGQPKVTS
jgi:hypothetical protein